MGYGPRALLAGGLGVAVSLLAPCGGGGAGLLSSDQASTLSAQLDQLSSAVRSGQCDAAASASTSLNNAIANLPRSVNSALAANLRQGAETASRLAEQECRTSTT